MPEIGKRYGSSSQESIRIALAELAGGVFFGHSPDYGLLRILYLDMTVVPQVPFPVNPDDIFRRVPFRKRKKRRQGKKVWELLAGYLTCPEIFANNLRSEYEVLHKAMITGGLSDIQACAWLDRVRENGLMSRFTFVKASEPGNPRNPDDPLEICSRYGTGLGRYMEPMP